MRNSLLLILLAVLSLTASPAAWSMGIRSEVALLAWSEDGTCALLELRESGPEGGGSLAYRIVSPTDAAPAFLVSSDLSDGAGAVESIPEASCREALQALSEALEERSFAGVTIKKDGCRERHSMLAIEAERREELASSLWTGDGTSLQQGELSIVGDTGSETLRLMRADEPIGTIPFAGGELRVARSPSGRLLLVIGVDDFGSRLLGIYLSESGSDDELVPYGLGGGKGSW